MEKRETNFLVRTVIKKGHRNQSFKTIEFDVATYEKAKIIAEQTSKKHLFSSTIIINKQNNMVIEFWANGKIIPQ